MTDTKYNLFWYKVLLWMDGLVKSTNVLGNICKYQSISVREAFQTNSGETLDWVRVLGNKKSPKFQMISKTEREWLIFISWGPIKHKILSIVLWPNVSLYHSYFVPIFFIFSSVWTIFRGSIRFKKFPI